MNEIESVIERLKVIFSSLEVEYSKDEWVMARFKDEFVRSMKADVAFEFLGQLAIQQEFLDNVGVRNEFLDLLLDVVRQSETTQIPSLLAESWERLRIGAEDAGQYAIGVFSEIAAYYRVKA